MSDNRSAAAVAMLCVVVINTKNTKLRAALDQLDQEETEEIVQSTAHLQQNLHFTIASSHLEYCYENLY